VILDGAPKPRDASRAATISPGCPPRHANPSPFGRAFSADDPGRRRAALCRDAHRYAALPVKETRANRRRARSRRERILEQGGRTFDAGDAVPPAWVVNVADAGMSTDTTAPAARAAVRRRTRIGAPQPAVGAPLHAREMPIGARREPSGTTFCSANMRSPRPAAWWGSDAVVLPRAAFSYGKRHVAPRVPRSYAA
jgi:hypothetical protein